MSKKQFPYYPIYLDIEGREVLVVGGGDVSARKAAVLLAYGARVTVVTPAATAELELLASEGKLRMRRKIYEEMDLDGKRLVIAATDDMCVNARVARDCRRRNLPVNVVDVTHLCDFILPAVVERGSIQLAISTGGKSPALATQLRRTLEESLGTEWSEANELLAVLRPAAKKALPNDRERRRFFDSIFAADILALLRDGRRDEALKRVEAICKTAGIALADAAPPPSQT